MGELETEEAEPGLSRVGAPQLGSQSQRAQERRHTGLRPPGCKSNRRQRQSCGPISLAIEPSVTLGPCPPTAAPVNSTTPDVAEEPVTMAPRHFCPLPGVVELSSQETTEEARGQPDHSPGCDICHHSGNSSRRGEALLTPEAHAVTMKAEVVEGGKCQSFHITRGSPGKRNGKLALQDHLPNRARGTPLMTNLLNHYNQVTKKKKKSDLPKEERCSLLQVH